MTMYWDGQYWNNETMNASQREYLMVANPRIYHLLFFPDNTKVHPNAEDFAIWHICFDEASEKRMDVNFKEYKKGNSPNFENDAILDIYEYKINDWFGKKYVGALSWRFGEKTGLTGYDVIEAASKSTKDCVTFMPSGHEVYDHPFSRLGFTSVRKMVEMVDEAEILPFKIKDYPINQNVWCNYWLTTPELFDRYMSEVLRPCMQLLGGNTTLTEQHRGKTYLAQCFFFEGLFSVFMQENNLTYEVI